MVRMRSTFCSFSVDGIEAAVTFYRDTLGMKVSPVAEGGPFWLHGGGGHETLVYPKPDHVPATFTVLNLSVEDIDEAVEELTARGVRMERYEGLNTDELGVLRSEDHSVAWFTDPAGNVLSVVQEKRASPTP